MNRTSPKDPPSGEQPAASGLTSKGVVLGVFAKHWTPGLSKTRLAATIGPEQAARAAQLFLATTLNRLSEIQAEHLLAYAPEEHFDAFLEMTSQCPAAWRLALQPDGTLGQRIRWFFEEAFTKGAKSALLLGSDSPDFPVEAVQRAIDWLAKTGDAESQDESRLVLGPSTDGGYWLIAAQGSAPPVLDDMPWSEQTLLEKTLARLDSIGWRQGYEYELVDTWDDIDTEEDLAALKARIRDREEFAELAEFVSGQ